MKTLLCTGTPVQSNAVLHNSINLNKIGDV